MIDKNLLNDLKAWDNGERPKYQFMKYISCKNPALTDSTIRRFMYEIDKEDELGEIFTEYFTAESFCRNIMQYFSRVADMYGIQPKNEDKLYDIIESIPITANWINLIISDLDRLSDKPKKLDMIMKAAVKFAAKRANIILIGGDYKEVFSDCPAAINTIEKGLSVQESDGLLMIGMYEQEPDAVGADETFEDPEEKTFALNHYWYYLQEQAEQGGFDLTYFKELFRDTWKYLMTRMTAENVCRKDIALINRLKLFSNADINATCKCEIWEAIAAKQFAAGLYNSILNPNDDNDELSEGKLCFFAELSHSQHNCEQLFMSISTSREIKCDINDLDAEIDNLAKLIWRFSFKKNSEDEK